MKKFISFFLLLVFLEVNAADPEIYPTHWWVGMKNPRVQLMIRGEGVGKFSTATVSNSLVKIEKMSKVTNTNYLFLDLALSKGLRAGAITIRLSGAGAETKVLNYELKSRSSANGRTRIMGINSADFIYLIMPDRFSNGDPSNDRIAGMRDQTLNRDSIFERHGGDLLGVQNHLDYLQDLGVTAIWLNPVLENDMPNRTEHGYAFTHHYKIDRRIGGEQAYHSLINSIHGRGMKIIQDAVYNHTGIEHFLYRDMPDSTWFHKWPRHTNTTYKDQVIFDPYVSTIDRKRMTDGWFTPMMPDINQQNPLFATFLIQHAIWSTEEFGLDGWRIDTYAYNDLEFMNRCNKALLDEYPQIHLFGETWVHGMLNQAYFTTNKINTTFKSNLPGVTDFQTHLYGILPALNENFGWTDGVNKLYTTLASDYIYKDAMKHVIFLDNHDKTRFFSYVNEDLAKYKMGIAWLLTSRGIPQLYYGTEVLMKGVSNPDGWVRLDFPGGWAGDALDKFKASGRTAQENEAFNYTKTFAQFRKGSSAIKSGKLMQYVPEDGVYVYFRYDNNQTVMCVMNSSDQSKTIDLARFKERMNGFTKALDVATGTRFMLEPKLTVGGRYLLVMELGR